MTLLCALWRFMPLYDDSPSVTVLRLPSCCCCWGFVMPLGLRCCCYTQAYPLCTHTHTHTHIYIYIYIYIHLGCHASRPFRRPVHRQTDPCERLKRQKPVLGLLKRWLLLRFDFQSTLFDFRSTTFDCRSTVIRSRSTVQSQSNRVMVVSSALAALS